MYQKCIKRILDILLSFFALIILSPVLMLVAVLVRVNLGAPVLFRQQRPGKNERIFTLYKFRTMTDQKDLQGNPLPDELRLTRFGRFLRSSSLDELPELFNILKGDMSIVGPRPLLVEYLPLYNECQKKRHDVRPGLSGLAQVSGRNSITWEERFELDVQYVETMNLALDIKIIFLTLWKAFIKREGISGEGCITMENFTGGEQVDA